MKLLKSFLFLAISSVLFATAVQADPVTVFAMGVCVNVVLSMLPGISLDIMYVTISTTDLATELKAWWAANKKLPEGWVYNTEIQLNKFARTITAVKGKFIIPNSVMEKVVQGFVAEWNAMGKIHFKSNEGQAYHLKVNYPITPSELEGEYFAWANEENKAGRDRSISRYCMEELGKKVIDDLDILSITGEYDANDLENKPMKGLEVVLNELVSDTIAGTSGVTPGFLVPIDVITESNAVDQVTAFERAIPKRFKKFIKRVFMSADAAECYMIDYENTFGANTAYKEGNTMKTRLNKWDIVPLNNLTDNGLIFATPDGNMLRLIDLFDSPEITDIQPLNYDVKVFMEFKLGYMFGHNAMVFVSHQGTEAGYENSTATSLYTPELATGSGS